MKLLEEKNLPAWKVIPMIKRFEYFVEQEKKGFADTMMRLYADMLCIAIKYRIVCCPSFPTLLFAFCFSWEGRTVISQNFVIDILKEYLLAHVKDCNDGQFDHKHYVDTLNSLVTVEHAEEVEEAIAECLNYDSSEKSSSDDERESQFRKTETDNDDFDTELIEDSCEEEDFTDVTCVPGDLRKVLELDPPEIEIKKKMEKLLSSKVSELLEEGTITFIATNTTHERPRLFR